MAKVDILLPFILHWEGGFVNDPDDAGGATNKGVTLEAWRQMGYDKDGDYDIDVDDLRLLTAQDVRDRVLVPGYWNRWRADQINDQKIANVLVDWLWCSGAHGIKIPQGLLSLKPDGVVGPVTLNAVNRYDPKALLGMLIEARLIFVQNIVRRNPSQKKFLKGWTNRILALKSF
jgi:lysozyme family protein